MPCPGNHTTSRGFNGGSPVGNLCLWELVTNLFQSRYGVIVDLDNSLCCPGDLLADKIIGYPTYLTSNGQGYPPGAGSQSAYQPPFYRALNYLATYFWAAWNSPVNTGKNKWLIDYAGHNDAGSSVSTNAHEIWRVKTNMWGLAKAEGFRVIALTDIESQNMHSNGDFANGLITSGIVISNLNDEIRSGVSQPDLVIDIDINVTALTGGTIPTVTFKVARVEADGVLYQLWQPTALLAAGAFSQSIGAGCQTNADPGDIIQIDMVLTGAPTSITFSLSVKARGF